MRGAAPQAGALPLTCRRCQRSWSSRGRCRRWPCCPRGGQRRRRQRRRGRRGCGCPESTQALVSTPSPPRQSACCPPRTHCASPFTAPVLDAGAARTRPGDPVLPAEPGGAQSKAPPRRARRPGALRCASPGCPLPDAPATPEAAAAATAAGRATTCVLFGRRLFVVYAHAAACATALPALLPCPLAAIPGTWFTGVEQVGSWTGFICGNGCDRLNTL